jgi:shikimate kinase
VAGAEAGAVERAVVLCGFMGVGKSSIGKRLARTLHRDFVDSDELVVAQLGRSIPALFDAGEEERFRAAEAEVIAEVVHRRPPVVLALGGGALGNVTTRELLLAEALLVHLDQPFEELAPALPSLRIGRPLLARRSEDEIRELFEERRALYAVAPISVRVARHGVAAAAAEVLAALGASGAPPVA